MITHASVCTGAGMFEVAAHWNGWQNVFTSEIDSYCLQLLNKRFPSTRHYGDFTTDAFLRIAQYSYRNKIQVLSAGLPCQPFSKAGKRAGQKDARHLGPAFIELCKVTESPWVYLENVVDFIEMAFDDLASALETQGYQIGEPLVLPAGSVGTCHQRYRMFAIAFNPAYANRNGYGRNNGFSKAGCQANQSAGVGYQRERFRHESGGNFPKVGVGNANQAGLQERESQPSDNGQKQQTAFGDIWGDHWFSVASRICRMDDGYAPSVDRPRFGGRYLDYSPTGRYRTARLKAGGNALMPQIAYEFYKVINHIENSLTP